jgi:hypothetical protein
VSGVRFVSAAARCGSWRVRMGDGRNWLRLVQFVVLCISDVTGSRPAASVG